MAQVSLNASWVEAILMYLSLIVFPELDVRVIRNVLHSEYKVNIASYNCNGNVSQNLEDSSFLTYCTRTGPPQLHYF